MRITRAFISSGPNFEARLMLIQSRLESQLFENTRYFLAKIRNVRALTMAFRRSAVRSRSAPPIESVVNNPASPIRRLAYRTR
jgi:hypothetical protein